MNSSPKGTDPQGFSSLAHAGEDGALTLSVLVEGVHCAACIGKIESALSRESGVQRARLNFSTKRLTLCWNADAPPDRADTLVRVVQDLGYVVHPYDPESSRLKTQEEERFLLLCLGIAGFAAGNIMLLSVGLWTTNTETMGFATRSFLHWISAGIGLPAILFSGRVFFRSAFRALSAGHANMDVPISVALLLTSGISLFETIRHGEHVYFDSAVMLMFFLLVSRYLDFRARRTARSVAEDLLGSLEGFALLVEGSSIRRIAIRDVREDMLLQIPAGERFPVDGTLCAGQETQVDTALVTGETLPRTLSEGAEVHAGTINLSAPVRILVSKAAENSLLADMVRLMEKAEQGQARYVHLANRIARLYTPVVHTLALATFLGWWLFGESDWQTALMTAVTVLIVTCPCALGLAVPVVQVLATGRLMKKHILLKSGDALERLAAIDTVILDKTGTLTLGKPVPEAPLAYGPEILQKAASLASHSTHPLSKGLAAAWSGPTLFLDRVSEAAGSGLETFHDGARLRVGNRSWCGVPEDGNASDSLELWFREDENPPLRFALSDPLRTDAKTVLDRLRRKGLHLVLLSGDRFPVVEKIAEACGITEIHADKKPAEKFEFLEKLKAEGRTVLMVGDGLNDAPSLACANVSMAPGTAVEITQNAADIVFMGDKLSPLTECHDIAQLAQKRVRENFGLALLYNSVAIPLAICGFVTPFIAALAMSGSSLAVILNSFRRSTSWTS